MIQQAGRRARGVQIALYCTAWAGCHTGRSTGTDPARRESATPIDMKQPVDPKQLAHTSLAALASLLAGSSLAVASAGILRAGPSPHPGSRTWASADAPANPGSQNFQQYVGGILSNEIQAQNNDHTLWRFREVQEQVGVRRLYDVIQTKTGNLHRLLALNGKPVSRSAAAAEESRIRNLVNNPSRIVAAQKKLAQGEQQEQSLLKSFPSAFIFRDEGQQGELLKVGFVPDPLQAGKP